MKGQYQMLLFVSLIVCSIIPLQFPVSKSYAQETGIDMNLTAPMGAIEVEGNETALPSGDITITGQGNVTIDGNLTARDEQGNAVSLEEFLLSGNLSIGCRRCHGITAEEVASDG